MNNEVTQEMIQRLVDELGAQTQTSRQASPKPTRTPAVAALTKNPETQEEIARVKKALSVLSPDALRGQGKLYEPGETDTSANYWLMVIWGLASLEWSGGEEIAREWSRQSSRYSDEGFEAAWKAYDPSRPNRIGIGSLFKLAQEKNGSSVHTTPALRLPALGANKKPLQVIENLDAVLHEQSITVRYNQISKQCEILVPGLSCVLDETSNTALTLVTDHALRAGMTAHRIPELVDALASQRVYCPVQTYINSRPWDGVSRFDQVFQQIQCKRPEFAKQLFRKWLIQAVAAAFEPTGIANAGVIVLTGRQGLGKTLLFKDLTSGVAGTFLEGQTLDPANKDSVMTAVSHWVVELGELDATFKKADLSQLKAFITKTKDTLRRPYARKDSAFARRTVFAGTVNDPEFLHDPTGNRRFWPIEVDAITRDVSIDYQQFWAEVKSWYDAGEKWYLSQSELETLNSYSNYFVVMSPEVEALLDRYEFFQCTEWEPKLMKDICLSIELTKPTTAQTMRLALAIRAHNGGIPPKKLKGLNYHFVPKSQKPSFLLGTQTPQG